MRSLGRPTAGIGDEAYVGAGIVAARLDGTTYAFTVKLNGRPQPEAASRLAAWGLDKVVNPKLANNIGSGRPINSACANWPLRGFEVVLGGPAKTAIVTSSSDEETCEVVTQALGGGRITWQFAHGALARSLLGQAQAGGQPIAVGDEEGYSFEGNAVVGNARGITILSVNLAGRPDAGASVRLLGWLLQQGA